MRTEPKLLNERLERLELVLDVIMPNCANLVRDALELLKEQPQIIRCKDCKHRPQIPNGQTYGDGFDLKFPDGSKCPCQCLDDGYYSWYPEDDWFCANGKRR